MGWEQGFEEEIKRAIQARTRGNEGQARVCARRAAGIAAGEYLHRRGFAVSLVSAIDLLKELLTLTDLDPVILEASRNLTMRVTEEFRLPNDADLIQQAQVLADKLLNPPHEI